MTETIRFIVDNVGEVVRGGNSRAEQIESSVSYVLPWEIEKLILTGSNNPRLNTGKLELWLPHQGHDPCIGRRIKTIRLSMSHRR